jgi:hypothetical protein
LKRLESFIEARIHKTAKEKGYLSFQDIVSVCSGRIPTAKEIRLISSIIEKSNIVIRMQRDNLSKSHYGKLCKLFNLESDEEVSVSGDVTEIYEELDDDTDSIEDDDEDDIDDIIPDDENSSYHVNICSSKGSSIGDSAILYLREMGKVSLLTREEEVILSKQIEDWQKVIREAILEIPFALTEIRKLCDKNYDKALSKLSQDNQAESEALTNIRKPNRLVSIQNVIEFLQNAETEMRISQERLNYDLTASESAELANHIKNKRQELMRTISKVRLSQDDICKVVVSIKNLSEDAYSLKSRIDDLAPENLPDPHDLADKRTYKRNQRSRKQNRNVN